MLWSIFVICLTTTVPFIDANATPIVLWHGMGDSCCFPFSMGSVQKKLEAAVPGAYVKSLRIGSSLVKDVENSYFLHPDEQIKEACSMIGQDERLRSGYNALGFSQGGQFLRALAQRCPSPRMKNLISVGGQHQGVFGLPNCGSLSHASCEYIRRLLNYAAYTSFAQKELVQATYWHDPLHEDEYKNFSTFMADINNERTVNSKYVENLQKLDHFVMIRFDNDTVVQPVATEWFGFYKPGQDKEVQPLEATDIYLKDRLGLQRMKLNGKLFFLSSPGNHLQFKWDWFEENVINKFLINH